MARVGKDGSGAAASRRRGRPLRLPLYADFLAKQGIRVALLDLCNNGQSYCVNRPIADDPAAQVKLSVDAARADGAQRVVLVGASLGASVAVTAAGATKPDAIVILSSSAQEEHSDITKDAPNVAMPALFALSRADHDDLVVVRSQLKKMPTKKKRCGGWLITRMVHRPRPGSLSRPGPTR